MFLHNVIFYCTKLKRIALAFNITTDWLIFEDGELGPADYLLLHFKAVSQFNSEEKEVIKALLME